MARPQRPQRDLSAQDGNPTSAILKNYTELMAIEDPDELMQAAEALVQPLVGHGISPINYKKFMLNLQQSARRGLAGVQTFLNNYMLKGSGLGVAESNDVEAIATFLCEDTNSIKLTKRQLELKRLVESAGFKVISELSRRDFIQQTAGGMASGNMLGAMAGKIGGSVGKSVDKLAGISDEELLETPETEWLAIISPQRLQRLLANNEEHFEIEIGNKFHKALMYGLNYCKCGEMFKLLSQKCGIDPVKAVHKFATEIIDLTECPGDIVSADRFLGTLKQLGVRPTPELYDIAKDIKESQKSPESKSEVQKRPNEQYQTRPDDELSGSSMHQPFESKLRAALGLI